MNSNHNILDAPFEDERPDFLRKGEIILWEGNPHIQRIFSFDLMDLFFGSIFFIGGTAVIAENGVSVTAIILFVLLILGPRMSDLYKYLQKKKTKYIITSHKIVFQLLTPMGIESHEIPFSQITNIVTVADDDNLTAIFFALKNPSLINFDTYNFDNNELRHQPTFELIKHPQEVKKIYLSRH